MEIGIVGLGLIGGSIAKALQRGPRPHRIRGVDANANAVQAALSQEAVREAGGELGLLRGCEAIFVCVPADQTRATVEKVYAAVEDTALITDVAGCKAAIMAGLPEGIRFVGGHPMAGVERGGFASSKAHLFENAYYCVAGGGAAPADVELLKRLIADMGGVPVEVDAERHDAAVSRISHLPHMAAYALVNTAVTDPLDAMLAAGGFKDITRVASSSEELWESVAFLNRERLIPDLAALIAALGKVKRMLEEGDRRGFLEFAGRARRLRDSLEDRPGALVARYELFADVEDKPGRIGEILSKLAEGGVNVANLYVENSREGAQGVLRLRFFDREALERAERLLRE